MGGVCLIEGIRRRGHFVNYDRIDEVYSTISN